MAKYKFLNINPLGRIEEDCVCRAISLALNEKYETIKHKLYLIGELFDCDFLCVCCYKHLLDYVYELTRIEEVHGITIEEFANLYNKGTYIVRVEGHCSCVIRGTCYDLWDCRDQIIDLVWEVK